jgi:dTDP-4-dehydrorhamnose reductase
MKVLITGSTGMLGSDCKTVFSSKYEIIAPTKEDMDIRKWDKVIEVINKNKPDVVINCAAYTDVDKCEEERELAYKINVEGARNLAQVCARFDCKIVHISSDYVFDGKKSIPQPYFEDDEPNPLSFYGKTKADSEKAVIDNIEDYIIIRTGWLYGRRGSNFVKWVIKKAISGEKIPVLKDQYGSPTWTYKVALQILVLLEKKMTGIFHATSEGYCTRVEWAKFILDHLGLSAELEPISIKDWSPPAKRPVNCLLENKELKNYRLNIMKNWKDELKDFLNRFGTSLIKEVRQD